MSSISLRSSLRLAGRQSGAALLAFMLVLVIAGASVLVGRLNEHAETYVRDTRTQAVLGAAKRGLLSYAMNYPEINSMPERGPGYLPCPDQNDDGETQTNCADSTGTTLGRLPYETLGLVDLRDGGGEQLWYAVSQDFKYNQPANHVINSERPGTIGVDGTGDVVAVILAPGEPVTVQSGRHGGTETAAIAANSVYLVAGQYLEDDNATYGDASFVSTSTVEFNDQVVVITRQELMEAVEKRVTSELRAILAQYRSDYGAYPWLAPFADPKADSRWLTGEHSGADNSANLTDSSADFVEWGVANGDLVWNLTDGSVATVTGVAATILTLGTMSLGADNDFDNDDEYYVEVGGLAGSLSGNATAGSAGLVLEDALRDFDDLVIAPGDVVDNITDGSSGMVESVSNSTITVRALTGGTGTDLGVCPNKNDEFCPNDVYRIRSNFGIATGGSAGLTLEDTAADFLTIGVQAGDMVRNLSDGSVGIVDNGVGDVTATTLTVQALSLGTENDFDNNDYYVVTRFKGGTGTTEGLLPVHEPGAVFTSAFSVDWSLTASNGNIVVPPPLTPDISTTYYTGITNWIEDSSGHSGAVTVAAATSRCTWLAESIADCRGVFTDTAFLSGTVDIIFVDVAGNRRIEETGSDFGGAGVKAGDKVTNNSNGLTGIISRVYASPNQGRVRVRGIGAPINSAFDAAVGDDFRVFVSTSEYTNVAGWVDTVNEEVCTFGADFTFVQLNTDVVRDNTNTSSGGLQFAVGLIKGKRQVAGWGCISYTDLQGGFSSDLAVGENYTVLHDFVDQRRYEFNAQFPGTAVASGAAGVRQRSVCLGYGANCQTGPSAAVLPGDGATPSVSIEDDDSGGNPVGSASATIPAAGTGQGSIRVAGLDYYFAEGVDLPEWFLRNRWHQLLYAAYSSGYQPGSAGSCVAGTDCLELSVPLPAGTTFTDRHAVVLATGSELASQDRSSGSRVDYLELENATVEAVAPPVFRRGEISTSFNDQVSIVCPDGLNPLCP